MLLVDRHAPHGIVPVSAGEMYLGVLEQVGVPGHCQRRGHDLEGQGDGFLACYWLWNSNVRAPSPVARVFIGPGGQSYGFRDGLEAHGV